MPVLMKKGMASHAETQRRWGPTEPTCILLCASASPGESIWFRPKAGLGNLSNLRMIPVIGLVQSREKPR
jgi:hypothetical protein